MDSASEDRDIFHDSLERCIHGGDFLQQFYERFVSSSDEVRQKFANTDFTKQKTLLRQSFYYILYAIDGKKGFEQLDRIAEIHSKKQLDIRPELYELWKDCLIATIERADPKFNDGVRKAWNKMLSLGIKHLVDRYEEHVPQSTPGVTAVGE